MLRHMRMVFILPFLLLGITAPTAFGQDSRTVAAEGVAVVQQGAMDIARDQALEDAQKRAIEQAIGILIDSQTQVENYQLISDKILSQTMGYIKRYNVTGEVVEGTLLRVRITAEVSLQKLEGDLSAIGILLGRVHKPRTMIMISEQNIDKEVNAWWWKGRGAGQGGESDIGAVENSFIDTFTSKGFEFVDHAAAARDIRVTRAYKVQSLSSGQARRLGKQAAAEVVIIGKAVAKTYGTVGGGMISVQADLSARAVRTDTGQIIASATSHAAAVHISEMSAGVDALKKAAKKAADEMLTKILAVYAKEVGGTRPINITIQGLTKSQFVKFKSVLRKQVRGIKELHERSFRGSTAKIQVDSKHSAQVLSDELVLKNFGSFAVEVTGSTANTLELRVTKKQQP